MLDEDMQRVADRLEELIQSPPLLTVSKWLQEKHPEIMEEYVEYILEDSA